MGAIWGVIFQNERVLQEMDLINPDCRSPISSRGERARSKATKIKVRGRLRVRIRVMVWVTLWLKVRGRVMIS